MKINRMAISLKVVRVSTKALSSYTKGATKATITLVLFLSLGPILVPIDVTLKTIEKTDVFRPLREAFT